MPARPPAVLLSLAVALAAAAPCTASAARDDVRVYRCTDERGRVALRDSPCGDGQQQEVRTMLRPVDGVPMARPAPPPSAPAAPAPQVVVLNAPQPMYRCVRPDGSDYTSDSSEGNPRWVPLWTLGYGPPRGRAGYADRPVGAGRDPGIQGRPIVRPHGGWYGPAGTWVRDECRPMPQAQVCGVLTERRETIRRRFFNAQPTERAELRGEETVITARLRRDCSR
ncbi:hypothetical protein [Luteimonas deserti]|uniref:DUF4124 domain-containing protein n=1 Tax=Luteimonas deserti TaxID=2752306 RepID=A0A7Z0QQX2_9GAMM|nr:hypothetical protein [Luteimonas deserti]NYZ62326.1 hypothetical protein [Luteimonas deserti]